eukprot:6576786-Pyramimonas_sp.AAC.3
MDVAVQPRARTYYCPWYSSLFTTNSHGKTASGRNASPQSKHCFTNARGKLHGQHGCHNQRIRACA